MKLIKPSYLILNQKPGLNGIYEQIELAGRTCYASEHNIKYDEEGHSTTAKDFVDRMIKSGHLAMLEHGTVYLKIINTGDFLFNYDRNQLEDEYIDNPYSKVVFGKYPEYNSYEEKLKSTQEIYITTNYRVLVENDWLNHLQFLCEPTEFHEKRVCVKFTTDIGVSRELNRHRKNSMAESSTRYCNYSKEKFEGEISICENQDIDIDRVNFLDEEYSLDELCEDCYLAFNNEEVDTSKLFTLAVKTSEFVYMNLIDKGWKPEQARRVLPLCTKTEVIHTAFVSDWKHWFDLRTKGTTGKPHPDLLQLSIPLMEEFKNRGLLNE